jgi:hypothetical protein
MKTLALVVRAATETKAGCAGNGSEGMLREKSNQRKLKHFMDCIRHP